MTRQPIDKQHPMYAKFEEWFKSKKKNHIMKKVYWDCWLAACEACAPKVKVEIVESERGWGQKVLETKEFTTKEEAKKFVDDYNSRNRETKVPDYYIAARIVG